nr:hypothetical protein [Halomonas elongata]
MFASRDAARQQHDKSNKTKLEAMQALIDRLDAWHPSSSDDTSRLDDAINEALALEPLPHGRRSEGMRKRWSASSAPGANAWHASPWPKRSTAGTGCGRCSTPTCKQMPPACRARRQRTSSIPASPHYRAICNAPMLDATKPGISRRTNPTSRSAWRASVFIWRCSPEGGSPSGTNP